MQVSLDSSVSHVLTFNLRVQDSSPYSDSRLLIKRNDCLGVRAQAMELRDDQVPALPLTSSMILNKSLRACIEECALYSILTRCALTAPCKPCRYTLKSTYSVPSGMCRQDLHRAVRVQHIVVLYKSQPFSMLYPHCAHKPLVFLCLRSAFVKWG